jgi:hypothetical protein
MVMKLESFGVDGAGYDETETEPPSSTNPQWGHGRVAELPSDLSPFSNGRTELCAVNWGRLRSSAAGMPEPSLSQVTQVEWAGPSQEPNLLRSTQQRGYADTADLILLCWHCWANTPGPEVPCWRAPARAPRPHWPAPRPRLVSEVLTYTWERWPPRRSFFVNGKQHQGPAAAHAGEHRCLLLRVLLCATNDCVVHIGVHRYRRLLR